MWIISEAILFWIAVSVFLLGLASVVLMRLAGGQTQHLYCWHCLFYMALLGLGLLTVVAVGVGNGAWMTSGAAMSVITIGATVDFDSVCSERSYF